MEFVKLYSSVLDSSIWEEPSDVRLVWITLLLKMNREGFVKCYSLERLAQVANVSLEAASAAIEQFKAPDKRNPKQEHQGRRIKEVEGGWLVLNGVKYLQEGRRAGWRAAQAAYRERKRAEQAKGGGGPTAAEREYAKRAKADLCPDCGKKNCVCEMAEGSALP